LISLIFILSFGTLGVYSYLSASRALYDNISADSLSRVGDTATLVSDNIKSYKQNLNTIASIPSIQSMNWNVQKPELIKHVDRLGCMRMGVIDVKGLLRSTNNTTADVSARDYFKKALEGDTVITEPMMSKVDGKMVFIVAAPIKSAGDKIAGVLIETYDSSLLNKIVTRVKTGKTGYAYMLDKNGITIAHPNVDLVIAQDNDFENVKKDPALKELADLEHKMVNGEKGFGEYSYKGSGKFLAYSPVPDSE
jgi:methyl-accepting chemotaxis protein